MAKQKYTMEYIRALFVSENYILLTTERLKYDDKLYYRCPNGHLNCTTCANWRLGYRCRNCANIKRSVGIERIKQSFELSGYTLLTNEYINSRQFLHYKCNKGHLHKIKWNDWQSGKRCPYCAGVARLTYDEVKKSFESQGYTLLDSEYKNSKTKLNYLCNNGHNHSITWGDWRHGYRCPYCAKNVSPNIEYVRTSFEKEGFTLLSTEYINAYTKLDYICPNNHQHSITWGNWRTGYRCPVCKGINTSINNTGPGHWNWQNGKSFEPYCEIWQDKEYKSDIRERDGNICLNPTCYHKDNVLTIHHIDYDKKNCHPKNLITICRSCNSRANIDRTWHKQWYQTILSRRYKYVY